LSVFSKQTIHNLGKCWRDKKRCHPERVFCAKDLAFDFAFDFAFVVVLAFAVAFPLARLKPNGNRKVLRPKSGLRMTEHTPRIAHKPASLLPLNQRRSPD
jgi:hypothetical protein